MRHVVHVGQSVLSHGQNYRHIVTVESILFSGKAMLTINDIAHFTWFWEKEFHLDCGSKGCYIWSNPDYPGGDNTIVPCGTYQEELKNYNIPYGRDKGEHRIGDYCGSGVKI